ncbi:acylphosphatase [Virgibacillus sp. NKC19-16]|uniref:acylphosphatase n=1 Tax=Virgibacillus salidurans TaxID=2831673 RepID=UPI001F3BC9BC|nr:acylphosphatase [Virgibacillus sp. NKC19-16]UJL45907.1 acylphosphatase [Virgibacillus sp. NKC19-16]
MKENQSISLPQLPSEIVVNARKTRLCSFAIALEGWRRGLKLKWYTRDSEHFQDMIIFGVNPPGRLYSLSSDERTHYFFRTRGDKVTNHAVEIGSEKDDTKEWMKKAGVPVPLGRGFGEEATDEEIIAYSKTIDFPLVLKPTNASLGNGVVTNINSDQEFHKAVNYVRHELGYREVVIEQHVQGEEYRVYVIEDQVVAAYNRVPANIIGDGTHNIEELIDLKNRERKKNARLNSCLIEIDKEILEFIQSAGYSFESIPKKGEQIFLRQKTNVSSGGDPIDVTDDMPEEYKTIAINALKAVPGLYHGGVDIIINNNRTQNAPAVVIELNPTAQIGGILYPLKGKARNIPGAIIDYYFPETKGMDTTDSKIYFDLTTVLEPLENRSALEVEVKAAPMGELYAKKYIVSGTVQRQSYHRWLKKQALDRNLHGYVKNMVFDEIEIIVAGTDKAAVNDFKEVIRQYPQSSNVSNIEEEVWTDPVTVGFEIQERYDTSSLKSVQSTLKRMEKDLKVMTKQKNRKEKDNRQIVESTSWKYTEPLRKFGALVKNRK